MELKYAWYLTSTETIRLIRDGEKGGGGYGGGGGGGGGSGVLCLHCVTTNENDFCIKKTSDDSHFNVLLITAAKVTRLCPDTPEWQLLNRKTKNPNLGIEPTSFAYYSINALPLGHTGSFISSFSISLYWDFDLPGVYRYVVFWLTCQSVVTTLRWGLCCCVTCNRW